MPIRVLVVDDSFFLRKTISKIISVPGIEVIGTAENGKIGVEKALELKPDIITLDIEMPVMTGLEALKIIMEKQPTPVLMVSTLTSEGAEATIDALSNGAVDFITKKSAFADMHSMKDELVGKIKSIVENPSFRNQLRRRTSLMKNRRLGSNENKGKPLSEIKPLVSKLPTKSSLLEQTDKQVKREISYSNKIISSNIEILMIGISTGGPVALSQFLPKLPSNFPVPILIVQHMPPHFTKTLSDRLNNICELNVKEAEDGDSIERGKILIAQGGKQMIIRRRNKVSIEEDTDGELYKPSVNLTLSSINRHYNGKTLGIIMTGMGSDGKIAFDELKKLGGFAIAQSPDSCIVPGMTNSVIQAGLADEIIHLDDMADTLRSIFKI